MLVQAVAHSVGAEGLKLLVDHFTEQGSWVNAAKVQYALVEEIAYGGWGASDDEALALQLLKRRERDDGRDSEAEQLEVS